MCLFVLHGALFGWTPLLVPRLVFACAMVVLFAIDLEHHLLPDVITLPGIVLGLVSSAVLPPGLRDALIGAVAGGGFCGSSAKRITDTPGTKAWAAGT